MLFGNCGSCIFQLGSEPMRAPQRSDSAGSVQAPPRTANRADLLRTVGENLSGKHSGCRGAAPCSLRYDTTGRRDVRTLTQHIGLGDAIMTRHGAGLVGIDVTL